MAKTNDEVMALVEDELKKNPGATVDELFDKARSVSPAVGRMSRRQFNARYPLQVKRRSGATGGGGATRGRRRRPAQPQPVVAEGAAPAMPRRRGRPPKSATAAAQPAAEAPQQPKRRGRPPKNPAAAAATGTGAGTGGGTGTGGGNREGVRQVFMRFANEIAGGGPKEIMKALSSLDKYVDDAIRLATR